MKKCLAVLLLVLLAAGSVFATGGKEAATSKSVIGLAMPETHVLRWIKDGNSLKAEAEKRGYDALVQWANGDQAIQNGQIESYLVQGAKGLIVGCINDGVAPMIAEAARDGVIVIAYDRIISNTADYDYYITFNNQDVGKLQAQAIVAGLDLDRATAAAPKYITLFAGSPTDGNSANFFNGAMAVLNPYIDRGVLQVVGPYPRTSADSSNFLRITTEGWQAPIAKTRMENLLNNEARNVTLDAVLAPNDPIALAIIEACKADAKYRTKLPVVTGQDAEFDSALSIKNGEQYCTVFKDTAKLAEAAIILMDQLLKGQTPNIPGATLLTGELANAFGNTGRKIVKTYVLDPVLVTKANLSAPINAGFYTAAEEARLK
jgi:putative multiple sugar transport system substrate-binding protein